MVGLVPPLLMVYLIGVIAVYIFDEDFGTCHGTAGFSVARSGVENYNHYVKVTPLRNLGSQITFLEAEGPRLSMLSR